MTDSTSPWDRPEWWEVGVGNLIANPELLRETLENLTMMRDAAMVSARSWRDQCERARALAVRLEGELHHLQVRP
jgi:hypothetical protein